MPIFKRHYTALSFEKQDEKFQYGIQGDERMKQSAFRYAFPKTIPVLVGYLFLGAAYGILMKVNGFGLFWSAALSLFVYAGSLQYAGVAFLAASVHPAYAFAMAFMINARHLFYGLSMLERYKDIKKGKAYLIFALTDETFSIVCNENPPEGLSKSAVYVWISFLNQCYWVAGSILGSLAGNFITFDTTGLDFALTALFIVIFTDQWLSQKDHRPALTGLIVSGICLWLFGAETFIIPAMIGILAVIVWMGEKEKRGERQK